MLLIQQILDKMTEELCTNTHQQHANCSPSEVCSTGAHLVTIHRAVHLQTVHFLYACYTLIKTFTWRKEIILKSMNIKIFWNEDEHTRQHPVPWARKSYIISAVEKIKILACDYLLLFKLEK